MTSVPPEDQPPAVISDLKIVKGGHAVLDGIAITLEKGVFAALVGPSGSGKTSLLRVIALLDAASRGTVSLWGKEFRPGDPRTNGWAIYPRLNYIPQTLALWPHLTIRENLLFAAGATHNGANLDELCAQLDITSILDRRPANASQGQRQRAALVRALLLRPKLLLVDEVTAALDERLATLVWGLLREFANGGGTILASTHDQRLADLCDRRYRISASTLGLSIA